MKCHTCGVEMPYRTDYRYSILCVDPPIDDEDRYFPEYTEFDSARLCQACANLVTDFVESKRQDYERKLYLANLKTSDFTISLLQEVNQ